MYDQEYDALLDSVCDWVQKFMAPLTLDKNPASVLQYEQKVRCLSYDAAHVKRFLKQSLEHRWAACWPETEEDIISSWVILILHEMIFETILYGHFPAQVGAIEAMNHSMQHDVQPARGKTRQVCYSLSQADTGILDSYSLRSWRADCFHSIIHSRGFRRSRKNIAEKLATQLSDCLSLFCTEPDKMPEFKDGFANHCIKPAMELHEKMMMSTNEYLLNRQSIVLRSHANSMTIDTEMVVLRSLANFHCIDILQYRKEFNLDKMSQRPTSHELRKNFRALCTIAPALMMKHADDTARPPEVIRKQRIVVAWGEDDLERTEEKFIERSDPPLLRPLLRR